MINSLVFLDVYRRFSTCLAFFYIRLTFFLLNFMNILNLISSYLLVKNFYYETCMEIEWVYFESDYNHKLFMMLIKNDYFRKSFIYENQVLIFRLRNWLIALLNTNYRW